MTKAKILLYWLVVRISEKLFSNDADVNSAFSASYSHVYFGAVYTFATVFLFLNFIQDDTKIRHNKFILFQILLFSYYFVTVFWSPQAIVSTGQALYSFYGLLFALSVVKYSLKNASNEDPITSLLKIWALMILMDYVISISFNVFRDTFLWPSLDEKALVAISIFILLWGRSENKIEIWSYPLLWLYFMGQSFSAIASSMIIFSGFVYSKIGKFFALLFLIMALWLFYIASGYIQSGDLTVYGKTWDYILTGSGRFNAWSYLVDEIVHFELFDLFFGRGYMSEREFLIRQDLSWGIDAHNNVIQTMYGAGLIGLILLMMLWFWPIVGARKAIAQAYGTRYSDLVISCHLAFISFGLSSSHYFSRPSISAIFMSSFFILAYTNYKKSSEKDFVQPPMSFKSTFAPQVLGR